VTRKADVGMSLEEIAEETGMSISTVSMTISRGLRKLRDQKLLCTARELAQHLDASRNTENIVRRTARRGQP
jgi:DNA-binding transcriptional ArsR family regulator